LEKKGLARKQSQTELATQKSAEMGLELVLIRRLS
jgi:hypothetical protein